MRLFWTLNASLSCILHISFIPDNDECSSANDCHQNASCHNTKGSYNCTCKDGFEGDGKNCSGKILFKAQPQRAQSQKKNLRKIRFDSLFIVCYHSFSIRMILTFSLGSYLGSSEKGLKISGGSRNSNPELSNAGVVLHQLSYQANWELTVIWVDHKAVDDRCGAT